MIDPGAVGRGWGAAMRAAAPVRPVVARVQRELCDHLKLMATRSDLPHSHGGRPWCAACGAFLVEQDDDDAIDWPATEAADRDLVADPGGTEAMATKGRKKAPPAAAPPKAKAPTKAKGKGKKDKPQRPPTGVRRGEPFDQTLPVPLTPADKVQQGQQLGNALAELTRLDGQLADAKASNKAAREPILHLRDKLADQLRSGVEYRPVRCQRLLDYDSGASKVIRLDTGKVVEERPMTEAERQRALDFDGPDEPLPPDPMAAKDDPTLANPGAAAVE